MDVMKVITPIDARENIVTIVKAVTKTGRPVAIGKNNKPEVLVVRAPRYNPALSDVTNFAALSGSFDFLNDEPDLYSDADIRWRPYEKRKRV